MSPQRTSTRCVIETAHSKFSLASIPAAPGEGDVSTVMAWQRCNCGKASVDQDHCSGEHLLGRIGVQHVVSVCRELLSS